MSAHAPTPRVALPILGALALWCSFVVNKSLGWAIVHFFCGFFYLVYAGFVHNEVLVLYFSSLMGL